MANRIPLIVNAGAGQIQELATGDTLSVVGNIATGNILTNGYYYANGTPVTFGGGSANLLAVTTDVIPTGNNTQSLGNATNQWSDLYVSNATIYFNSVPLSLDANNQLIIGGNTIVTTSGTGNTLSATDLSVTGNVSAGFLYGNGAGITGLPTSNYSNANVAAYLPTYSGELVGSSVSATGNVQGQYILGNVAFATGIPATYGNANVAEYLTTATISTTGNITGAAVSGNGAGLTNLYGQSSTFGIGRNAAQTNQGNNAIAMGNSAGQTDQGQNSIAIGAFAGQTGMGNSTIILNAGGSALNGVPGQDSSFYVSSIRNDTSNTTDALFYNTTTREITWGTIPAPTVSLGNITFSSTTISSNIANAGITIVGNGTGNVFVETSGGTWTFDNTGKLNAPGAISAQGNVNTSGNVSIQGNVATQGIVSAVGNIVTDGYFVGNFAGNITGNIVVPGANTQVLFNTNGNVDAVGGLTYNKDSNVLTVLGAVSAQGNVYGNVFVGNGSQLTDLPVSSTLSNSTATFTLLADNTLLAGTFASPVNFVTNTATPDVDMRNASSTGTLTQGANLVLYATSSKNWKFDSTGNLTFPDNTVYSGDVVTLPTSTGTLNTFAWQFNDNAIGNDTITLVSNLLDTTLDQWYLSTNSQTKLWTFDSAAQQLSFGNAGDPVVSAVTFGTAANSGVGNVNAIELTSTNSNVYLRANDNSWTFDNTGNLTAPGNIIAPTFMNTGNIVIASGNVANTTISFNVAGSPFGTLGLGVALGANAGDGSGNIANAIQLSGIAIGTTAGQNKQGTHGIAVGWNTGTFTQGNSAVAIGENAAWVTQGDFAVALGAVAGREAQGANAVAIGTRAGLSSQGGRSIAIGTDAGNTSQGANSVAVGWQAGLDTQGTNSVAIGKYAGNVAQGSSSVAIGASAGASAQGVNSVGVGVAAAERGQGNAATALGWNAGQINQGNLAIAVGSGAAYNGQGNAAIAIGVDTSPINQGAYSIAIGAGASTGNIQANNSILIDATGTGNTPAPNAGLYIAPVRNDTVNVTNAVYYNTTTKEVTYAVATSVAEASFSIQTSNFNAVAGSRYGVDTTGGSWTATLPATPATGAAVFFADAGGNYITQPLVINPGDESIMDGLPGGSMTVTTNGQSFGLFYNGTTWRTYN